MPAQLGPMQQEQLTSCPMQQEQLTSCLLQQEQLTSCPCCISHAALNQGSLCPLTAQHTVPPGQHTTL